MQLTNVPQEALILPNPYVPPAKVEKQLAIAPDFSTFNPGQLEAIEFAKDYIEGRLPQYLSIGIEGYAGVGKTYWEQQFVKWLLTTKKMRVGATAPTNKAVNVISDGADYHHPQLIYKTVHSFLGLKEEIDEFTGKQKFVPGFNETVEIENIDVLIIDEASMFPDDLFDMIYDYVTAGDLKLVFIGDSFQIPPVGKIDCIPFTGKGRLKYQIGIKRLTEIVRQAQDSPIISYATAIREGNREQFIKDNTNSIGSFTKIVNGSGIIDLRRDDKDAIYGVCDHFFGSPMFEINPDFFKVIAWRNKTVDAINTKVRGLIYKEKAVNKLVEGEKLVAHKPIAEATGLAGSSPKVIYTTNQEFEVKSFITDQAVVYESGDIKLDCKYYVVQTIDKRTEKQKEIQIIHESDEPKINALLAKLRAMATAKGVDPQNRKWLWKNYYGVERRFANVKYNYAITGHKSQGSTYDNCMVIDWDILENKEYNGQIKREALRILYVGVSRPKKFLFLVR